MKYKCASFFSGVGGIDLGFEQAGFEIIYANEIDSKAVHTYNINFKIPADNRDIQEVIDDLHNGKEPANFDFDILLAGFPCQAFSIAGHREGFNDNKGRGGLFFKIMEIVKIKQPKVIFLENVKNLKSHDNGNTYKIIKETLEDNGYFVDESIMNTMIYGGIPQNRERIYIVAFKNEEASHRFSFKHIEPIELNMKLEDIIDYETKIDDKFYYTEDKFKHYEIIKNDIINRSSVYQWRRKYVRENKSGVCPTLTANMGTGGHNVPLILTDHGIRKLTPRECFSFQGFPNEYILPTDIAISYLYKQAGNSVSVPVIKRIAEEILLSLRKEVDVMFFEKQPEVQRVSYIEMLKMVGSLSNLFSNDEKPLLHYRAHENIFCKYFQAENLARHDCSADAKKESIGIGLKTWVGSDTQKVAEFGKLKEELDQAKNDYELALMVSKFRNIRIETTMNLYGLENMYYHVVKRIPNAMQILECAFDFIDIKNISINEEKTKKNSVYFSDSHHTYYFNKSKTTLYMVFDELQLLEEFKVEILPDPYAFLENAFKLKKYGFDYDTITSKVLNSYIAPKKMQLCLPLYAISKGKKYVPEKNGLNLWNASGRKRNLNEISISFHKEDRIRAKRINFFPPKGTSFMVILPDNTSISAKVCSGDEEGKEIMSNPNSALGEWLLRKVLKLPQEKVIDYKYLKTIGIDSVMFTKLDNLKYKLDFCDLGTYEELYEKKDD